ncbi:uncharacterized protein LOC106169030 [Lingula anatina]|uniref:Uncharacterized protein LOC106169030 n=1 Tax=Lingula anatina TaxID=7574 RepID=A0A1S3J1S3_LINAN|nr:uncharacterized protein LOC106169030 [Lingula anatina]|eukprot:XP_013403774.1 uncharacterized protein LOC106169030 [Lingula anatina]
MMNGFSINKMQPRSQTEGFHKLKHSSPKSNSKMNSSYKENSHFYNSDLSLNNGSMGLQSPIRSRTNTPNSSFLSLSFLNAVPSSGSFVRRRLGPEAGNPLPRVTRVHPHVASPASVDRPSVTAPYSGRSTLFESVCSPVPETTYPGLGVPTVHLKPYQKPLLNLSRVAEMNEKRCTVRIASPNPGVSPWSHSISKKRRGNLYPVTAGPALRPAWTEVLKIQTVQ